MAHIALDARKYYDFGIGTYIQHLVEKFSSFPHHHTFTLFVAPEDAQFVSVPHGWKKSIVSYGKYSLSELAFLGLKAVREGAEVFHAPHYTLPFGLKRRAVVTIHDLTQLKFPQFFSRVQRAYTSTMIRHAVRDSAYVITDSEYTRQDILRSFRVNEEKVITIHLGVDEKFRRCLDTTKLDEFRRRSRLKNPFILYVGNTKRHKGLGILVEAFARLAAVQKDLDLVFVGGLLCQDESLNAKVDQRGIRGRIIELGRVSDSDLVLAYNAAEVLVLPSFYEGFGLPAIEAMACETPVVVSSAASLPEIVGDAGLICEMGNVSALKEAITSVLKDSGLRSDLVRKAGARAKMYSWEETARKTIEVYEKVL